MEFFATAGNIPVHILDSKKGEKCVILLHGYLETMYVWNELYDILCKKGLRVIVMDLPGHGMSCSAPVNTMDFAATCVSDVLKLCGVQKAVIVGHSLGGYVGFSCLRLFPEMFEKMVLINSHPYPDPQDKAQDRLREIDIIESGKILTLAGVSIPKMYAPENLRRCDEKIRESVELCETHDPEGIVASIKGMAERADSCSLMVSSDVPFMAVLGDKDIFIPMETIEKMKVSFPKVRFEVLGNCGHNSFVEYTEKVAELLVDFI